MYDVLTRAFLCFADLTCACQALPLLQIPFLLAVASREITDSKDSISVATPTAAARFQHVKF